MQNSIGEFEYELIDIWIYNGTLVLSLKRNKENDEYFKINLYIEADKSCRFLCVLSETDSNGDLIHEVMGTAHDPYIIKRIDENQVMICCAGVRIAATQEQFVEIVNYMQSKETTLQTKVWSDGSMKVDKEFCAEIMAFADDVRDFNRRLNEAKNSGSSMEDVLESLSDARKKLGDIEKTRAFSSDYGREMFQSLVELYDIVKQTADYKLDTYEAEESGD